jgi:CBS domain containing-hemolysin-like protein
LDEGYEWGWGLKRKIDFRWVVSVTLASVTASAGFTFLSSGLGNAGYAAAFGFLLVFILIGIVFDMVGVAVTAASPGPLHSMAARREKGAAEAIALVKNAGKVSSVCNDVVGDIVGIISGATSAIIVARLAAGMSSGGMLMQLLIPAAVTGVTIGGKALGKTAAINSSTAIVVRTGRIIRLFRLGRTKSAGARKR